MTQSEWRELLQLVLAQRLEINALGSALKRAAALTDVELRAIRAQASDTAKAWISHESDDLLTLIRIHSLPDATMNVPSPPEK
jgi:hypothetical protein